MFKGNIGKSYFLFLFCRLARFLNGLGSKVLLGTNQGTAVVRYYGQVVRY